MSEAQAEQFIEPPRRREVLWMLGLFISLTWVFRFFPEIDLIVSGWFYREGRGFFSPQNWWLAIPYYGMPRLAQATGLFLFLAWLGAFWVRAWKKQQVWFGFLLAALLVGPHLIVGLGLKENVGRARPANIVEFGGWQAFSPAFVVSDQCHKNCAFVSAHVASAAFLMAFGWLGTRPRRQRWLWVGALAAGALGLARMAQGGHFLSDVVFAYFAVYVGCWVTEFCFLRMGWLEKIHSG